MDPDEYEDEYRDAEDEWAANFDDHSDRMANRWADGDDR